MATNERILSIDIGASSIRMAEFEHKGKNLILHAFDWRRITYDDDESDKIDAITDALRDMLAENNFTVRKANLCSSGQYSLVKFIKLPPIVGGSEAKIKQMVQHEAEANIPFPLNEVSWDYQLLSSGEDNDELEVMIVVMKNEIIDGMIQAAKNAGILVNLVDVSSVALLNAMKANGVGSENPVMLLDIGDRCSDLLFIDGNRFFSRTINIAGQAITQQISKEFKIGVKEAEELKRKHGFVALGAGYEEHESEVAAIISKIIRNVMTRLYSEIARSKTIYSTQQKGGESAELYLTGGSSVMRYTDLFFKEKLGLETYYFNPFEVVQLNPRIQPERLQPVAHTFGAVVGTALHAIGQCPIEISLMPESLRKKQDMSPKKKFLYLSMLILIFIFALMNLKEKDKFIKYQTVVNNNEQILQDIEKHQIKIIEADKKVEFFKIRKAAIENLLELKISWSTIFNSIEKSKPEEIIITKISPVYAGVAEKKDDDKEENEDSSDRGRGRGRSSENEQVKDEPKSFYDAAEIIGVKIEGFTIIPKKDARSPESVFEDRLRQTETFKDGSETKVIGTNKVDNFKNVTTFTIEALFTKPIILGKE